MMLYRMQECVVGRATESKDLDCLIVYKVKDGWTVSGVRQLLFWLEFLESFQSNHFELS